VLDDIRFDQSYNYGYYYLDSNEGFWNSGREEKPNLGYKPRYKEGYFPVQPMDSLQDIRSEMVLVLEEIGSKSKFTITKSARRDNAKSTCALIP
jgi:glutamine synthetase